MVLCSFHPAHISQVSIFTMPAVVTRVTFCNNHPYTSKVKTAIFLKNPTHLKLYKKVNFLQSINFNNYKPFTDSTNLTVSAVYFSKCKLENIYRVTGSLMF